MRHVFISTPSQPYITLMKNYGFEIASHISDADLILFTGGSDVNPALYNQPRHSRSYVDVNRDAYDMNVFKMGYYRKTPMAGICRGGQFLNVMNGGKMVQHVEGHCGEHSAVFTDWGKAITVTSTHHQMMEPTKDAELVLYDTRLVDCIVFDGNGFKDKKSIGIEAVIYESEKHLCFQPHPELWIGNEKFEPMRAVFGELLDRILSD